MANACGGGGGGAVESLVMSAGEDANASSFWRKPAKRSIRNFQMSYFRILNHDLV
jgi:hypothetical protein